MMKMTRTIAVAAVIVALSIATPAAALVSCNTVNVSATDCSTLFNGTKGSCTWPQIAETPASSFNGCIKFTGAATWSSASLPPIHLSGVYGSGLTGSDTCASPGNWSASNVQIQFQYINTILAAVGYSGSITVKDWTCCTTDYCNTGLGLTFLAGATRLAANSWMLLGATIISASTLLFSAM